MNNNGAKYIFFFCVAIFVLFILGKSLVTSRQIPSLSDYIASTTVTGNEQASSTIESLTSAITEKLASTSFAQNQESSTASLQKINLSLPKAIIETELARTSIEQSNGLSYRKELAENSGMLFVFENPGSYGFWMKDMNFPLDIVWIGPDKKIVSINENVSPKTYPEVFVPAKNVTYVLEINAGSAKKFGLKVGTAIPIVL